MTQLRIGVDLGGTKIEAAALDANGAILARLRIPTPAGEYNATIEAVAALVAATEARAGASGKPPVGVGIPGSLSPATGLVRNANSTVLNGRPIDRDLVAALGRPVAVENDANCFALAEARAGAGRDAGVVLGLILGTGVGAGIVVDGRMLGGANGIAGEWGHMPLPAPEADERPGTPCWCGRLGCVETWLSGPGLAADHARRTGRSLAAAAIAEAAAGGDAEARETLQLHRARLGRALAVVVDVLDPDVIVLGGGLSNLSGLAEDLPAAIRPHVFSDVFSTPVRRHTLGDSAGVIGAAWRADGGWPAGAAGSISGADGGDFR